MTNEELVARALYENAGWRTPWDDQIDSFKSEYIASAGRVVAALTEAGRLLPPGLTLPKGEKAVGFCVDLGELRPFIGNLDAEPTP